MFKRIWRNPLVKTALIGVAGYVVINLFGGKIKEKIDEIAGKIKP
jgi:hypothetical protein